jgi:hypothetical protein
MRRPELTDFSEVFLLLLDYLQRHNTETSRCYAAVSVCTKRGILRPTATAPLFFFCKNSENSGAHGSRTRSRATARGRPGMTLRVS